MFRSLLARIVGIAAVTLGVASTAYAAPVNVAPANEAMLVSAPITFGWTPGAGERSSTITIERLYYDRKNNATPKLYERSAIPDGTAAFTTKKRYFFGTYRWSVASIDAAGAAVTGATSTFTVKERMTLGAPKVAFHGKGRKQLRVTMPMSANGQFLMTAVKITVGKKVWWSERAPLNLTEKGIDDPLKGVGFITERTPAVAIPRGTKFKVVTVLRGESTSRTTSTTFTA